MKIKVLKNCSRAQVSLKCKLSKLHTFHVFHQVYQFVFQKLGLSRPLFFFIFVFSIQLIVHINFADDWIRTADLWFRKRLLYQLRHNHFPVYQFVTLYVREAADVGYVKHFCFVFNKFLSK